MFEMTEPSLFVVALPERAPAQPAPVFLPRPQTASNSRPRTSNRHQPTEIVINPRTTAAPAQSSQDEAIPSFIQVGPKPQTVAAIAPLPDVETIVPRVEIEQSERAQAEQAEINAEEEVEENDKCSRYVIIGVVVFFIAFLVIFGLMLYFV